MGVRTAHHGRGALSAASGDPLRIMHVAESFGGGVLEVVKTIGAGCVERGHEVAIVFGTRPETPADLSDALPEGVDPMPMPWTTRRPAEQLRVARLLSRAVQDWKPDVVHLHSAFAGAVGAMALPRSLPVIYSPHATASMMSSGLPGLRGALSLIERMAARRATVVGAVSESEAKEARERLGLARVVVVENGIPELDEGRGLLRAAPARPRVLAVGRTVPQRQPEAAARILSAVREVADVAWVGGGGGDRGRAGFDALIAAGIEPTGWVSRDQVLVELASSTAYLHWTAWDGQAVSILDAMATDAVVVASDIPANRDILGDAALCRTEREAVDLLKRIVTSDGVRDALLARQRQARRRFGSARMVNGWLSVYSEVAASRAAHLSPQPPATPAALRSAQ